MIQDAELTKAVAAIPQRSERQPDLTKLVGAFVDVGIVAQVQNTNNQIIYGRRGTGKTHIFRVLGSNVESAKNVVVYLDARTLGSTTQFSDTSVSLPTRCTALFRDILGEIHESLLNHVVAHAASNSEACLNDLSEFASVATKPYTTTVSDKAATRTLQKNAEQSSVGASVGIGWGSGKIRN